MANISAADIKKLREITGAGMSDVKKALVENDGDMDRASSYLREKGLAGVMKRGARSADNGLVHAYLHRTAKDLPPTVGVLIELNCETDFVAKNEAFQELARELALHIASADPLYVSKEDVPADVLDAERKIYESAAREEGKPEAALSKIVEGRVQGYYKTNCLMEQAWVKDGKQTIRALVDEAGSRLSEKIIIGRFARFKVGSS